MIRPASIAASTPGRSRALIAEVQTDEWWIDVTLPMLESMRRRLRLLVPFIEKTKRKIVYSDFEDQIGAETGVALAGLTPVDELERFRRKTRRRGSVGQRRSLDR